MSNITAKVAIIMPAYNASEFIEASVRSILKQSCRDIQLIVVNDGSKDGTLEKLKAWQRKGTLNIKISRSSTGNPIS